MKLLGILCVVLALALIGLVIFTRPKTKETEPAEVGDDTIVPEAVEVLLEPAPAPTIVLEDIVDTAEYDELFRAVVQAVAQVRSSGADLQWVIHQTVVTKIGNRPVSPDVQKRLDASAENLERKARLAY